MQLVSHPHTIPLNASDKCVVLGISVAHYALLALSTHILFVYSFWVLLLLWYFKFSFIWDSGWLRLFYLFFSAPAHTPNPIETWSDIANIINHNCISPFRCCHWCSYRCQCRCCCWLSNHSISFAEFICFCQTANLMDAMRGWALWIVNGINCPSHGTQTIELASESSDWLLHCMMDWLDRLHGRDRLDSISNTMQNGVMRQTDRLDPLLARDNVSFDFNFNFIIISFYLFIFCCENEYGKFNINWIKINLQMKIERNNKPIL